MNSKKAKALRKSIYGDAASKGTTTYAAQTRTGSKGVATRIILTPGSKRAQYQAAKRQQKKGAK